MKVDFPLQSEKLRWREARLLFEILSDIRTCIDFKNKKEYEEFYQKGERSREKEESRQTP